MFQNGSKRSTFFEIVNYGPILSETVQNSPKSFKESKNYQIGPIKFKLILNDLKKNTLVGVTAVGVTAVRNNLEF